MEDAIWFLLTLARPILFITILYLTIRLGIEHADKDVTVRTNGFRMAWDRHPIASILRGQGKRNHNRNKLERAHYWYDLSLKAEPNNPLTMIYKGRVFLEENKLDEAEAIFNRVLKLDPINYWAFVNLGYVMMERHEYRKAIEHAKAAIKLERKILDAYFMRFNIYFQMHEFVLALRDLEYLMEKNPGEFGYHVYRSSIYAYLNQTDAALKDAHFAVKHLPKTAESYHQRAWVYSQIGEYETALADANQALALGQAKSHYYDTRAAILFSTGKYAEALEDYRQAKAQSKKPLSSEIGLALVAYKTMGLEDTKAAWSRVQTMAKADQHLAEIEEGLGQAIQDKYKYPKPLYETIVEVEKLAKQPLLLLDSVPAELVSGD